MKTKLFGLVSFLSLSAFCVLSLHAEPAFPSDCYTAKKSVACNPMACDPACEIDCTPCDAACDLLACNPCDKIDSDSCGLFKRQARCGRKSFWDSIEIDGWLQAGVFANGRGATTTRNRGENYKGREVSFIDDGNSALMGTNNLTDFQVNQIWLNLYKEADGKHGLDWGFRSEVLFGPDAWFYQSFGDAKFDYGWQDGDYYTAIPQLYVQLAYGDWSVKVGKYETLVGLEAMRAPDATFYSHSHLFMVEPSTHNGFLAEYTPNDKFYLALGYTTGGDASFENKYGDHGIIGHVAYQFTDRLHASYAFHYSRYGIGRYYPNGEERAYAGDDSYIQHITLTYDITKRLQYAMQWNWADSKNRDTNKHRILYGIANYLTYQLNDRLSLGFRAEWVKDDADADGGWAGLYAGEATEYTLGLNWKPYDFLSIRPEVRYDRCSQRVFNYNSNRDQFSGGVCGVVTF